MRSLIVLGLAALSLPACGAGHLGDGPPADPDVSPGMVTVRLLLPATRSFCDQVAPCVSAVSHVAFGTGSGQWLTIGAPFCAYGCATCQPTPCPGVPVCTSAPWGVPVTTVETSWDGSYVEQSTCGNGAACFSPRFVRRGRYVARLCATPGVVTGDGAAPTCTATGPQECVDVPFDLPGPSPVEGRLPDAIGATAP